MSHGVIRYHTPRDEISESNFSETSGQAHTTIMHLALETSRRDIRDVSSDACIARRLRLPRFRENRLRKFVGKGVCYPITRAVRYSWRFLVGGVVSTVVLSDHLSHVSSCGIVLYYHTCGTLSATLSHA